MMNDDLMLLDEIQKTIENCTKNPENFLSVQDDIVEILKKTTKQLYDLAFKANYLSQSKSKALPELIIQDFDTEQIWQQIELENNEKFSPQNLAEISKILTAKASWESSLKDDEDAGSNKSKYSSDENEEEEELISKKSDDFTKKDNKLKRKKASDNVQKRKKTTEVDDKFFKLNQLDEYLKKEDKREINVNNDNANSDEESIDLFNDFSDMDDKELEDNEIENEKSLKYADFFDSPESDEDDNDNGSENDDGPNNTNDDDLNDFDEPNNVDDDLNDYDDPNDTKDNDLNVFNDVDRENENDDRKNENDDDRKSENDDDRESENDDDRESENDGANENQQKNLKQKKQVKFNLLNDSEETNSQDNLTVKEQENKIKTAKSSLETRQEKLKKRITELEQAAISEKPWQLMGETNATSRPQNSLLEEYVEFDTAARPAPIMTEQTTMKLEDIIRGRIKDKVWDDVEKKFKPVETPKEFKKKLIMNQEKSKESLAQIYENEYIKQREALNLDDKDEQEKEPLEHVEIKQQMHDLFTKLDALSNFHYTPKLAKPEIKIISNIPAISMEEVAPVATTNATLLAPEEIQPKRKGELIGKSERTKTDMKRERRKKKIKQHLRAVNESKKLVENTKQKKSLKNAATLGKLKGRNIINTNEETSTTEKSLKSSTAFFAKLQDQVESTIKQKTSKDSKKKNKNVLSAVKLKL